MEITTIKHIFRNYSDLVGKKVKINGWVRTIRSSKAFGFIEINDGSFFKQLQVVFEENL
ncbi:asparagine--tRNA ligase, partial [bacterium]|nr:asparagine--tRNA ligase [bacterium]